MPISKRDAKILGIKETLDYEEIHLNDKGFYRVYHLTGKHTWVLYILAFVGLTYIIHFWWNLI